MTQPRRQRMANARMRTHLMGALLVAALIGTPRTARAHTFELTDVVLLIKADNTFVIDMTVDVDAMALGVSPAVPSQELANQILAMDSDQRAAVEEHARQTIRKRVKLRFDDKRCEDDLCQPRISFPGPPVPVPPQNAEQNGDTEPTVLGVIARLEGTIPQKTDTLSFSASRAFQQVKLTIFEQGTRNTRLELLSPGSRSTPFRLNDPTQATSPSQAIGPQIGLYLWLGFEHILPKGLDHILFVLGLFLLTTEIRPLIWQVSAFTISHSVTLALAILGVATLPGTIVEPLIAASIAYVAIENLWTSEMKPWRTTIVFAFGLLHGMGFASVLTELGLPSGGFIAALVAFNVGVEFGQLAVVGLAWISIGMLRRKPWYRKVIVIPLSLLIAATGVYWFVERIAGS